MGKGIESLAGRRDDVDEPFVSEYFEVLTGVFVYMRTGVDGEFLPLGRQGHRTNYQCPGIEGSL